MKMNLFRKVKSILLVGLAAALLSTPAYGAEFSESQIQEEGGAGSFGSYRKDCATGEVQYIPPASETYSIRELDRLSAQYDPFADKFETEHFSGSELYSTSADSGTLVNDPWSDEMCRNTVLVTVTTASGYPYKFTGFMIGPNAVATAGHCIYNTEYGGDNWVTSATVIPARNTGVKPIPFNSADAIAYECGKEWAEGTNNKNLDDWGIIILGKDLNIGWLGLQAPSIFKGYKNTEVWLNGYPELSYDMYRHNGKITTHGDRFLISTNIFTYEGESGGPCYLLSDKTGYTAIALLTGYDEKIYMGSRYVEITKSLYNKFISYRASTLKG